MASHYIQGIKQVQPKGPYRIMGWSSGGTIAYAMGQLLRECGEEVGFIGLIDSFCRPEHVINDPDKAERLKHGPERLDEDLQKYFLLSWLNDYLGEDVPKLKALSRLATTDEILKALCADDDTLFDVGVYKRNVAVRSATTAAILNYEPQAARGEIHLFATTRSLRMCENLGWDECGNGFLRVVKINSDHMSAVRVEKHVKRLTTQINRLFSESSEK
jgi:syringomycin synthetase protein SyrE